jgi:hypothetical protein
VGLLCDDHVNLWSEVRVKFILIVAERMKHGSGFASLFRASRDSRDE